MGSSKWSMAGALVCLCAVLMIHGATHAEAAAVECEICNRVAGVVEGVLLKNATKTNTFQKVAAALCAHLPEPYMQTCKDAASRLNSDVYKCMIQEAQFGTLCSDSAVALCKASRGASFYTDIKCDAFEAEPLACAACEFSISGLQQYVNDTSRMIVRASTDDICKFHFPTPEDGQMCQVIMKGFGEVMLRTLVRRLDAADFCCGIGLCQSNDNEMKWIAEGGKTGRKFETP